MTFGRCALHTQGHTANTPLLNEQMSENTLWINTEKAQDLDIADGDTVHYLIKIPPCAVGTRGDFY